MQRNMAFVITAFALAAVPGRSSTLTVELGTQHFADGQIPGTGTYLAATAGQPAPFNGLIGSDIFGPNFSALWTFDYLLPAGATIASGTLILGLYDVDAAASGTPAAAFTLNTSTNLTDAINQVFQTHGTGKNSEYDVYTLNLPSSTFPTLATGQAEFSLALQGPGLGVLGLTPFNGAGLDFSTLEITTAQPVPEPNAALLTALGLALVAVVGLAVGLRPIRTDRRRRMDESTSTARH